MWTSIARWYGVPHTTPDLLQSAVYGLSEVNRQEIVGARLIATPGCYPTSVNLALYPLAKAGWLQSRVIVDSKSGGERGRPQDQAALSLCRGQ